MAERIDQSNAKHAMEQANVTEAETLAALEANGAKARGMLSSLSDPMLDNSGGVPFGSQPMSGQQFGEYVVLGHINGHLANIKAVLV